MSGCLSSHSFLSVADLFLFLQLYVTATHTFTLSSLSCHFFPSLPALDLQVGGEGRAA